jgi:hypothetical protein
LSEKLINFKLSWLKETPYMKYNEEKLTGLTTLCTGIASWLTLKKIQDTGTWKRKHQIAF